MAYAKRVPQIKMVLTVDEYNALVGILTKNNDELESSEEKESALIIKEKLLKFSIPNIELDNNIEIDVRLYINETMDIINQLLLYIKKRTNLIDYYQVLLKVRENLNN